MGISVNQEWLEAVMLAGARMVAFLVVAPPFSYNAIPARVKAMLGIGLALAVAPVASEGYTSLGTAAYFTALVLELGVGFVLGFLVLVIFAGDA